MATTHLEIDERLQKVAKAHDDTAASAAITASQLQVAEDHLVTLAEQSEKTSSQVEATSGEVKLMANSVNALLYSCALHRGAFDCADGVPGCNCSQLIISCNDCGYALPLEICICALRCEETEVMTEAEWNAAPVMHVGGPTRSVEATDAQGQP